MDIKELEHNLRGVTLAEPPLGFDPDDLATRAARSQRNRRAVIATGGAVVCVAAAAVTFTASYPVPAVLEGGEQPSSSTAPPGGPPGPDGSHPDLAEQRVRNQAQLRDVLPTIHPGATEIDASEFIQAYPTDDSAWDLITGEVTFRDDAGPAYFTLTITGTTATGIMGSLGERCTGFEAELPRCDKLPQPDGSTVVVQEFDLGLHAIHYRTDGSTVNIINDKLVSGQLAERYGGSPGNRPRTPLTEQQAIALVTDPAFNLN